VSGKGGRMRVKIAIFICILIGIANAVGLYLLNTFPKEKVIEAENGILSLEHLNLGKEGNIILGGEWEFYPNIIITPQQGQDAFAEYSDQRMLVRSPNKAHQEIAPGLHLDKGTFRLIIQLREDSLYGINAGDFQNIAVLYMNGIRVCNNSEVKQKEEGIGQLFQPPEGFGRSENRRLELVIQLSGIKFEGQWIPAIEFGTADQIMKIRDLYICIDAFVISGFFILGILFLWNYFFNRKMKYGLFFSLFLLLQSLYTSGNGERLLLLILPPPKNILLFYEGQIQLMYLSTFCFMMAVYYLLRPYMSKRIVVLLSILLLLIGPVFNWELFGISEIPGMTLQHHKLIISAIVIVCDGYIFWTMSKSLIKGVEGTEYVMVFSSTFMYYVLTLILEFLFGIKIEKISAFLFLIMVISITLYINYRLQLTFSQVDRLSRQLLLKDQERDQFLARTSWELKKPVDDILNISEELLLETAFPADQLHKNMEILKKKDILKISSILEELLETYGDQPENAEFFPEPMDGAGFTELLGELELLLPRNDFLDMRRQIPERFPIFLADRNKLREILYYLLHNAIKFTSRGEITVRVEAVGDVVHITVKDTGMGMNHAQLNTIFTAFYQEKRQEAEGLGLGLTIARKLIKLQGGEIWAASEPGKGTAFTFTLPLAESTQIMGGPTGNAAIERAGERAAVPEQRRRLWAVQGGRQRVTMPGSEVILVVEGAVRTGGEAERLKEVLNYPVAAVGSGTEALEYAENNQVDLVLTDLILSDMSGYELCQKLREKYNISELPVIILDDTGHAKDMQRSFQSGASDFLSRPISWEELSARIEARLSAKKSVEGAVMKELKNLHAQIMPHFLYNTLNTIIGLSYKDTEKACEALQHLSTYFRAKLDFSGYHSFVPLDRELELMRAYLEIERMRYNERLEVIYDIDETIYFMLPALTLQPLVENAVQHGITDNHSKVTIQISIQKDLDKGYIIKVSDNGPGIPEKKQQELLLGDYHRIGFSNVLKKVRLLKGSGLWLDSNENSGTCITIYISREYQYGTLGV
jgi:two-component system sensor histidine kinase ChiS